MEEIEYIKNNILEDNDASFAPFGYAFQADAGLYLFCEYYKDVKTIKIESALQDIEMLDKNNRYIMAQAKASQDPYNCDGFGSKLFDALFSLARHYINDDDKLIYVTNIPNLFGEEMKGQFDNTIVKYSLLSKRAKDIVKEKLELAKAKAQAGTESDKTSNKQKEKLKFILKKLDKFNLDNLSFLSITRYLEGNDKKTLTERIAKFLHDDLEIDDIHRISAITDELFSVWHNMFYYDSELKNSSKNKTITKEQFCWPIITVSSLNHSPSEVSDYIEEGYDDVMGAQVETLIRSFSGSYDYELMNDILNNYRAFIPSNRSDKKKEYILKAWEQYSKYFKYEDKIIEKAATIFFLYCTLSDYSTIAKVIRGKSL